MASGAGEAQALGLNGDDPDALALSRLPCQGAPDKGGAFSYVAAPLALWREQHPKAHEQVQLDFASKKPAAQLVPLFDEE